MRRLQRINSKIILALVLLVAIIFPALTVQDVYAKSELRQARVGFFEYSGYHEIDKNNKRTGYGEDFFRMLQRYTNLRYKYVDIDKSWDELFPMLENGEIDVLSPVRWTPERAQRFDFSHSIGRNYAQITARSDDTRFDVNNNDYSVLNGARIGVLQSSGRVLDLQELARQKGFSYVPVIYSNEAALTQALQNKEVDLVETSSLRKTKHERIIAKFAPEEFFAIVRKGDSRLLSELNYGIEQMDINEGDWRNILFYKNYLAPNSDSLNFSQRELDYIEDVQAGRKKITATVRTDLDPFAYNKGGKAAGIIPEYFAHLMEMAGLPYEVVMPRDNNEYMQWVRENKYDVFMSNFTQEAENPAYGAASDSYIRMNVARITRKDFSGDIKVLAALSVNKNKRLESNIPENVRVIEKPTREAMLQAVASGEADVCYVYSYVADKFIRQHPDAKLTYTVLANTVDQFHVVVAPQTDHELASIINKCIRADNGHQLDELVKQHMEYSRKEFSLLEFMRENPGYVVLIVLIIAVAVYIAYLNNAMRMSAQQLAAERLQYAEKLRRQNQQLEESMAAEQRANMAKRQFLFNMSHDIRTPMNAILGFTDLAAQNLGDENRLKDYLHKIRRSGDNLLSLINNVLEMSRIETGKQVVREVNCDTHEMVKSIIVSFDAEVRSKGINFVLDSDVKHTQLWVDPMLMRQVTVNLLSNAFKYTPKGGTVTYCLRELPSEREGYCRIKVVVKDTGIGISKEFLPHIFEQFEREHTKTESKVEGSGLGMSIVKRIIDLMGAEISIESEQGKGTTVTMIFEHRIAERPEKAKQQAAEKAAAVELAGRRILLAEDNDLNAEIALTVLRGAGMQVDRAADGAECVELLQKAAPRTYELILMDVQMPKVNGYEATRKIRALDDEAKRHIPIVAMTANAFAEDREKAQAAGMDDFLPKPVDVKKMMALLAKLLRR